MDIENTFENLEKIGEQNFDKAEFEKQIFDFVNQLDKIWDILRLASLVRWAQYENENDAIEIALSYKRLIDEINLTQDELSKKIGKKRSTISNYLRLLKLRNNIYYFRISILLLFIIIK